MRTDKTHITTFGTFRPYTKTDTEGYIEYHDSQRYSTATDEQLETWRGSRFRLIRNAAAIEQANRQIADWRN